MSESEEEPANETEEELITEYKRILGQLQEIDKNLVSTSDGNEMLALIEQSKPLSAQLDQIYEKIIAPDREARERVIKQAQKAGGVIIHGKEVKLHKNGAKILLSKSYLDDQVLDAKAKYTVILLHE